MPILSAPVATALNAKGAIPENHFLSLGVVGLYSRACANRVVAEADLVFFIGSRTGSQVTNNYAIPKIGTRTIQLDIDPEELGRTYPNIVSLCGDVKLSLRKMLAAIDKPPRQRAEWLALPQALILCGGIADKLAAVLEGLEVDEARMRANLGLTRGQIMAEAVMMALGAALGHEAAHALVHRAARRASEAGTALGEELAGDPEITRHVTPERLAALVDPASYLGLSAASATAVADRVEGAAP